MSAREDGGIGLFSSKLKLRRKIEHDSFLECDDVDWADRNNHWMTVGKPLARRAVRERRKEPLVLCGHGASLVVDKGTLLIKNGLTHYPQERETFRFFKSELGLPSKIIILDGSGHLTFDVMSWLSEQNLPLFRIDYRGEVVSMLCNAGSVYDPEKIAWQVETYGDSERRLAYCSELISKKIEHSLVTLQNNIPNKPTREKAIGHGQGAITKLRSGAFRSVGDIMLIEARAAAYYFSAWHGLPLRWKAPSRHPIPRGWHTAGTRSTARDAVYSTNRHATHPVNAMLNYAYAVTISKLQLKAINDGYDPRRGIMHESRDDASAFILDQIEPYRPRVDAAILSFVSKNAFTGADFFIRKDGVCRLAPQLAKRLVAHAVEAIL